MAGMRSLLLYLVMPALVLVGTGCSGESDRDGVPRLDLEGTQEDFDQSQEAVRESLTDERREIFDEAMRTLYFRASALRDAGTLSESDVEAFVKQQMHDHTAEQIVEEALRTFREFCTDNQISDEDCRTSIEAAGFDAW